MSLYLFCSLQNRLHPESSWWKSTEILVHAVITCHLDMYSLLCGFPDSHISKRQCIQNSAARLVIRNRFSSHITSVLRDLHWLPVKFRIMYKIVLSKGHNLIFLSNQIRLNLVNTFVMSRNKHTSKKTPMLFVAKEVKIKQNQMNLKDAFWNWVVTQAQTIQNVDMHLACLEMRAARMNFDLTFYVVWLRFPLPRYNNGRLKNCMKLDENENWSN